MGHMSNMGKLDEMNTMDKRQWRGLAALVTDAVVGGTSSVERIHRTLASRPFAVLEAIPIVSAPSAVVRAVLDASTRTTYASIRGVTRLVGCVVDAALDDARNAPWSRIMRAECRASRAPRRAAPPPR